LRGHKGPVFCLTGTQQQSDSIINYEGYNFVFSAGSEGIIKVWNVSKPENVDALGSSDKNLASVGEW